MNLGQAALLDDLGLSQEAPLIEESVMSALQDLMQIDDVDLYETLRLQSGLFASAAQPRPSAVPSPGTLSLMVFSMLGLIFLPRLKISSRTLWRG